MKGKRGFEAIKIKELNFKYEYHYSSIGTLKYIGTLIH
jgi:hypothetical protein